MDYILNESSLTPFTDVHTAREAMERFVRAASTARRQGLKQLRVHETVGKDLYHQSLTASYLIGNWLNDDTVERDLKELFRQIMAAPPLITPGEMAALHEFERSAFTPDCPATGGEAHGLCAAHLLQTLSVSFDSHECWRVTEVKGSMYQIEENGDECTVQVAVKHFFSADSFRTHLAWLAERRQIQIESGTELWDKRSLIFKNLVLCGEVEHQLARLGNEKQLFQIIQRLTTLDQFALGWDSGGFNLGQLNATTNLRVSPESDATIREFGGERTFDLPSGDSKLFDLHVKTGKLRFHFFPDDSTRNVYVGYIGPHLKTSSEG